MKGDIYIPIISSILSGGISYYAATVVHKFNKRYKRKEKAVEMADEFSKLISKRSFDIGEINKKILENVGLQDKINELENKMNLSFDNHELRTVFTDKEIAKYHTYKKVTNTEFIKILLRTFKNENYKEECLRAIILEFDNKKTIKENIGDKQWTFSTGEKEIVIKSNDVLQGINTLIKKYNETHIYCMNKLEYFSVHFTNNIADSNTVYQSLHQIYLKTILSLYIDISSTNKIGHEKFYVNLIEFYNEWNNKKIKFKKKTEKRINKNRNSFLKTEKLK
ncbi:hypothetical protein [Staphylococcus aureus]|uniref:hypothetical protein n=1 Tax=Staphylococcus aureus TaxID=1280 RepID=UPI003F5B531A